MIGLALAGPTAANPPQAPDNLPLHSRITQDGISAELRIEAQRSGPVPLDQALRVSILLKDEASGEPLRGLRPRLWLARQTSERQESCPDQVRRFAGGRLSQRADRDLNSFHFLTLNADATVSVINPQIQLNNTKLEALIPLPGVGSDWVYASEHDLLLVTLAERGALAAVDLARNRVVKTLDLGPGRPVRLVLQPDQSTAWIAMNDSDRLVAVDLPTLRVRNDLSVGDGAHHLAQTDDGRHLLVSSTTAQRITVIDAARSAVLARLELPREPRALTYSALSRRAYVSLAQPAEVWVIDPVEGRVTERISAPAELDILKVDPSGRFVIGLSSKDERLVAIDAASAKVIGTTAIPGTPDQLAFTHRFAYVRSQRSLNVTLLELESLGTGKLATNSVPFFQRVPSSVARPEELAEVMARSPEGDSMVVGNPADTALYYYAEGMMAPQGSYQTYTRALRGLLVVDRSLREVAPGQYSLAVKLDRGGTYSLPLLVGQPRLVHCFALRVDEVATANERRIGVDYRVAGQARAAALDVGSEQLIDISVTEAESGQPIRGMTDLQLMVLELPGLSQQRRFATETAPGQYRVKHRFLRAGKWRLTVQSQAQGLRFEQAPAFEIQVIERAPVAQRSTP
ncbi:MAG: YncE family protein [Burkholderiaceae bacterium]